MKLNTLQNQWRYINLLQWGLVFFTCLLLSQGCSSDDDKKDKVKVSGIILPNPDDEEDININGVVAIGKAVDNATIIVKDRQGETLTLTANTDSTGRFQLVDTVRQDAFPLEFTVNLPQGGLLSTLLPNSQLTIRNINPITSFVKETLLTNTALSDIDETQYNQVGNDTIHKLLGSGIDFEYFHSKEFTARTNENVLGESTSVADVFLDTLQTLATGNQQTFNQLIKTQIEQVQSQQANPYLDNNDFLVKLGGHLAEVEAVEAYSSVVSGSSTQAVPQITQTFKTVLEETINNEKGSVANAQLAVRVISEGILNELTESEATAANLSHLTQNITNLVGASVIQITASPTAQSVAGQDLEQVLVSTVKNVMKPFETKALTGAVLSETVLSEKLGTVVTTTNAVFEALQATVDDSVNSGNAGQLIQNVENDPNLSDKLNAQETDVNNNLVTIQETVDEERTKTLTGYTTENNQLRLLPNDTNGLFQETLISIGANGQVNETPSFPNALLVTPNALPSLDLKLKKFGEIPSGTVKLGLEISGQQEDQRAIKAILNAVYFDTANGEMSVSIPINQQLTIEATLFTGTKLTFSLQTARVKGPVQSVAQSVLFNPNQLKEHIESVLSLLNNNFVGISFPGTYHYKIYVLPENADTLIGTNASNDQGEVTIFNPFTTVTENTFKVGGQSLEPGAFVLQGSFMITP